VKPTGDEAMGTAVGFDHESSSCPTFASVSTPPSGVALLENVTQVRARFAQV
jgi:hypothetical protein